VAVVPVHRCLVPLRATRRCLQSVRQDLYNELVKVNPDKDWSFVLQQIGM
jgi:aspartate/tyrosine/aromatic aminotransferase